MFSEKVDITAGSPDRFGYEWSEYREIRPEFETQFRRWTPFFRPEDWIGKVVLDVGCGMGRNSYWPLTYGAREAVCVDVDDRTLASARETLFNFPNAVVCRMSAYDIEYLDYFDIVFSLGVIHHLEAPQVALEQMVRAAKPGGQVLIWVYGYENNEWIVRYVSPLRNMLLSRMPISLVHHLSLYPTVILWLLLRVGLTRLLYFQLIRGFSFRHLRSIVFDQMLPKIAHYWSRDTVEYMMSTAGLKDIRSEWVNEVSWSVVGVKPNPVQREGRLHETSVTV